MLASLLYWLPYKRDKISPPARAIIEREQMGYRGESTLLEEMSHSEAAMFSALGFSHLFDTTIHIMGLYEIAIRNVFIEGKTGPAVESLRRCAAAIEKCKPYRRTDEFDALIYLKG